MWKAVVVKEDMAFAIWSNNVLYILRCAAEIKTDGWVVKSVRWEKEKERTKSKTVRTFPQNSQACALCENSLKLDSGLYCKDAFIVLFDNGIMPDGVRPHPHIAAVAVEPWSYITRHCENFELDLEYAESLVEDPFADDAFDYEFRNHGKNL